jgi:hypothetical protein
MSAHAARIQRAIKLWGEIRPRAIVTISYTEIELLDRLFQVAIKHLERRRKAQARKRAREQMLREQARRVVEARLS